MSGIANSGDFVNEVKRLVGYSSNSASLSEFRLAVSHDVKHKKKLLRSYIDRLHAFNVVQDKAARERAKRTVKNLEAQICLLE